MTLVVIESPYAGPTMSHMLDHVDYARKCMSDSLKRGEYPIASHLLYTQAGILDDNNPEERKLGIEAGLVWGSHAGKIVFYTDFGWSKGMLQANKHWSGLGIPIENRSIL